MQVFQVSLAICLVAAIGCRSIAAQNITVDSVLQALGITPNMNAAQINARVAVLAENLNDALDDVVGVAALIDKGQLQARLGEFNAFFKSAHSGLDGKSRDEILAVVEIVKTESHQLLIDLLADIGFNATDPHFADLMAGLLNVSAALHQQYIEQIKSLEADELRKFIRQQIASMELTLDTVSDFLDVVDVDTVPTVIDHLQQKVQSWVDKSAGLRYDQLRARIQPVFQTLKGHFHNSFN